MCMSVHMGVTSFHKSNIIITWAVLLQVWMCTNEYWWVFIYIYMIVCNYFSYRGIIIILGSHITSVIVDKWTMIDCFKWMYANIYYDDFSFRDLIIILDCHITVWMWKKWLFILLNNFICLIVFIHNCHNEQEKLQE